MILQAALINPGRIFSGWVLANFIGWAVGLTLGALATIALGQLDWVNVDRTLIYAVLVAVGLTSGLTQWTVIRHFLPYSFAWVFCTLGGYLLVLLLIALGNQTQIVAGAAIFALICILIGLPQWLLLRRSYQRAVVWVAATAIGFVSFLWLAIHPITSPASGILTGSLLGALAAVPPGLALVWLVRRPSRPG
jgi:hypothetical protein